MLLATSSRLPHRTPFAVTWRRARACAHAYDCVAAAVAATATSYMGNKLRMCESSALVSLSFGRFYVVQGAHAACSLAATRAPATRQSGDAARRCRYRHTCLSHFTGPRPRANSVFRCDVFGSLRHHPIGLAAPHCHHHRCGTIPWHAPIYIS